MVQFNFTYDPGISLEQRIGFELAARIWGTYLTDDISVNLHIVSTDELEGDAIGGAIPILHEQNYGVLNEYLEQDATSSGENNPSVDEQVVDSLQDGNTVDVLIDGEVVDGNSTVLLTSAQAKALGMDEAITLDNGSTWDRDLVDANALDGYIVINQSYDWDYDYLRANDAPNKTLDFLSLALHEIGHQLGFVSGLDGILNINQLYSGEAQAEGFSLLDLFRHTADSQAIDNPDGAVSDLSTGTQAMFSVNGGEDGLAMFSTGQRGDGFQAAHWKRTRQALGVMDPTLAYRERLNLTELDAQAFDALGYDVNYEAFNTTLNLGSLILDAEMAVAQQLGLNSNVLAEARSSGYADVAYDLSFAQWWQLFETQILELGYGEWWQILELGYGAWFQAYENGLLELGYGTWWQQFEAQLLDLGYGNWFQEFEGTLLELGYGNWWQLLELGYGNWWQQIETFFATLERVDDPADPESSVVAGGGVANGETIIFRGGTDDDIIAGDAKQDRIKAGDGDDLIDGKAGHDVLWGESGNDLIYGQKGNDLIYGGSGDDLILGEAGHDKLHGEAGDDIASGGQGDDIVTGGAGRDDLQGGGGEDVLSGDGDNDRLHGEAGHDAVIGGEGRDQVNGDSGNDLLYGDAYLGEETLAQLRQMLRQQAQESNDSSMPAETPARGPIRIEVESMTLSGDYRILTGITNASDGQVVRDLTDDSAGYQASSLFTGATGNYMVVVRYRDEADGTAQANFSVNGQTVEQWSFDRNNDTFVTRTLATNLTLTTGDTLTLTGYRQGDEGAQLDYIELVPLESLLVTNLESGGVTSGSSTAANPAGDDATEPNVLRVEAEAMTLSGDYQINSSNESSGGQLIRTNNHGAYAAATQFTGDTGFYNIVVGYYDEYEAGIARMSTALNNTTLDAWDLDLNWSAQGSTFNPQTEFVARQVATGVMLNPGDIFELQAMKGNGFNTTNGDESARFDYVEFIQVDAPIDLSSSSTTTPLTDTTTADASLVAHWAFDDGSGLVAASETGKYSATLVNTANNGNQWTVGEMGSALKLDGVNDYVAVAGSGEINSGIHRQRTISLWFRVDDAPVSSRKQVIYEEGGGTRGLNIYLYDGNLYVGGWNDRSNESGWSGTFLQTDKVVSGQWHHVALVLDGDTQVRQGALKGYLDGEVFGVGAGSQLWGRDTATFGAIEGNTRFHDGISKGTGSSGFAGQIDDAYLYNRALSADEVGELIGRDNDLIQGGADNDIAFGGQGNDVVYGESQLDNSSAVLAGSHTYNGHTYLLSSKGSWTEAQAEARRLGGNLVTINDAAEDAWLRHTFSKTERFWMGLSDAAVEGQWEWVSGEAVTYTNWAPGEPNNVQGGQDYGSINLYEQWDDTQHDGANVLGETGWAWQEGFRGIIELDFTNSDTLFGDSGNDNIFGQAGNDFLYGDTLAAALSEGLAAYWHFDEGSGSIMADTAGPTTDTAYRWGGTAWAEDAQRGTVMTFDGERGGVTANHSSDLDIAHQLTLSTWVKANQFRDNSLLIGEGTTTQSYGINLSGDGTIAFSANQGTFGGEGSGVWHSDTQLSLDTWHHVAVTYDGEAIRFYIDGQLDSNVVHVDLKFASSGGVIYMGSDFAGTAEVLDGALDDTRVYNRAISAVEAATLATSDENSGSGLNVAEDAVYHNGSYYLLTSADLTWEKAQAQAQNLGGNLVTISDASEENWLQTTFGTAEVFWIGMTDRAVEGQFEWASGEAVTYTNWALGQPDDHSGTQDYGLMNYGDDQEWDDANQWLRKRGIIEINRTEADNLVGGIGNDALIGGLGDDVLNGTDAVAAGNFEKDTLLGGAGADTFILGDAAQAYYQHQGDQDYALIKDFTSGEDMLQLHGSAGSYTHSRVGNDLYLYAGGTELIAILENVSSVNLTGASVSYV